MVRWPATAWVVVAAAALPSGCGSGMARPVRLEPALRSAEPFELYGAVSRIVPDTAHRPVAWLLLSDGTVAHVTVLRLTRTGMTMAPGDRVRAWCRQVGPDIVADSAEVVP